MKKELIVHQDPKSPISEVFRTLRTNIQFMNTKGKLKTLLVTSTMPSEGKSWVASNLAVTFAQAGKKVVLIDADMRKGRQYTIFGASPRPGLSNYLSGVGEDYDEEDDEVDLADYIQETGVDNLYLIAAGNVPPNPSELLIAPQMVELLDRLKEVCDIIIIDGTPAQLVTDALILARLVDSTVVVAASNQTKKEDLKRCVTNIQNVGGKIAGIVMNKMPINAKKYEQSYYYGSTTMSKAKSGNSRQTRQARPQRKQNSEMYKRASDIVKQGKVSSQDIRKKNPTQQSMKTNNDDELPKALTNKIKIENTEEVPMERTKEILNQINKYLDEEKKKIN